MSDKNRYVYLIRAMRPAFRTEPTQEESTIMREHFAYLKSKFAAGELLLAGPCSDAAFGIVIFEAESEQAALEFMNNDPSVKQRVMGAELHEYRISLMKGTT